MTSPAKRALFIIDATHMSGPAKGLLQFLRFASCDRVEPLVVAFRYSGRSTEFVDAVTAAGYPLVAIEQAGRWDFRFLRTLEREVRRRRVDFVQSHSLKPHVVGHWLARRLGVPWIAFAHGWTWTDLRMRVYNRIERVLIRRAQHVCVVTQQLEAELRRSGYTGPITVLANGVDISPEPIGETERAASRRALDLPSNAFVLASIGRLSFEKGQDVLLKAMAGAFMEHEEVIALIAGEGPASAELQRLVRQTGIGSKVRMLGHLSRVREIYASADVVVVPSRTEGVPNVVLEALDYGRPVVASAVGAIPSMVLHGETGWLVDPDRPDQLAAVLRAAHAASRALPQMAACARSMVLPRFSASARAERLLDVYASL